MSNSVFKYKLIVFIGRFQPIHYGHLKTMEIALQLGEKLVVVLGSSTTARNIRNPWSPTERQKQILSCFSKQDKKRIQFIFVRDRLYNDIIWQDEVQLKVNTFLINTDNKKSRIGLIGHSKDHTSYYLKLFPSWETIETPLFDNYHSTKFRDIYFGQTKIDFSLVPPAIKKPLENFKHTSHFKRLRDEYYFIQNKKINLLLLMYL